MNSAGLPMPDQARDRRRWQTSLPMALLIAGVALSVSTACITSAVVQSMEAKAAEEKLAAKQEPQRAEVQRALIAVLPPAAGAPATDRLTVTRNAIAYSVVAVGDFSGGNIAALKDAAHRLYIGVVPIGMHFDIFVYRQQPRELVVHEVVDALAEMRAELQPALPPASPRATRLPSLSVSPSGDQKILYVSATGAFSAETISSFLDAVKRACARFALAPRFIVTMMTEGDSTHGGQVVGRFDSDASP